MSKFSYRVVCCHNFISKAGDVVRFNIAETLNEYPGAKPRYQAISTGIVRCTLEACLAALQASCEHEDAKTEEEIEADLAAMRDAERRYMHGVEYACGIRD